ncbi:MAG: twin-arginine translocase subunit TatC [Lewinellaceae bacterium]|nr:twin-arginine translocase subunit TatC [Saprospiraceae bacterium]MCB9338144.1 twin-arginine translocase subunit TatC [Lewinellaceae bacterium]
MALDQLGIDSPKNSEKAEEKEMSFFDHLEELRWHIFRSVVAVFVIGIAVFIAKDFVFNTVIFGPKQPDFITYILLCRFSHWANIGETLCIAPPDFQFVTPNFGEPFLVHIQVSLVLGVIGAIPFIFWEIWKFVKPGLYERERQLTRYAVGICSSLFLLGVLFGYYIVAPFAVSFLAGYNLPGVTPFPSLSSYIGYMVMLTMPTGLIFELPVAVYVLTKLGIVSSAFMKSYRRHAAVVIVIVAAIITPPDVFSQVLISVPLILLYEVSITIAKRVEKQEKALMKT